MMADMLSLIDGKTEIVFDERDFTELVGRYLGSDAVRWLEAKLDEVQESLDYSDSLEKEMQAEREEFRGVIYEIREQSEILAGLISEPKYDRKKISAAAGRIGVITWENL